MMLKMAAQNLCIKILKFPAKKGLTLFWPSDWTHTHRGIVSNIKEKYIVTGMVQFIGK
jgi:hypothetical protein